MMTSGQIPPSLTSPTNSTTGTEQLSAASSTIDGSGSGASPLHSNTIGAGFDAVGGISSPIVMVCVTRIWLSHSSVTLYVRMMTSGHIPPSLTSPTNSTTGMEQLSAASVMT